MPTGFGETDMANVTSDIDTYQELYPDLCGGYFFDEAPGTEENVWKCEWSRRGNLVHGDAPGCSEG